MFRLQKPRFSDLCVRKDIDSRSTSLGTSIKTNITQIQMKVLLTLCTKKVHFSFDGKTYKQNDDVAMGSPPVFAGIFMVELEEKLLPTLQEHMKPWK